VIINLSPIGIQERRGSACLLDTAGLGLVEIVPRDLKFIAKVGQPRTGSLRNGLISQVGRNDSGDGRGFPMLHSRKVPTGAIHSTPRRPPPGAMNRVTRMRRSNFKVVFP